MTRNCGSYDVEITRLMVWHSKGAASLFSKMRPSVQASACKPYHFMLGPSQIITDRTRNVSIQLFLKRQVSNRQCQLMLHNDGSSRARVHYVRECVRHDVIVTSPKKVLYPVAPSHCNRTFAQRIAVQRRRESFRPWYYSRGWHRAAAALRAAARVQRPGACVPRHKFVQR